MRITARFIFRLTFGILAVVIGSAVIYWTCYNQFIKRLPQYQGFHWWEPLGIGPAMIGVGIYWLRGVKARDDRETDTSQPRSR